MTSGILYLGRILSPNYDLNTVPANSWCSCQSIEENIKTLPFDLALKVLLDQEMAAAYLFDLYGCDNDYMIDAYIEELNALVNFWFLPIAVREKLAPNMQKIVDILKDLVCYNKAKSHREWKDIVEVDLVTEFCSNIDDTYLNAFVYPVALADKSTEYTFRSYLYWRNAIVPQAEATITDSVRIPVPIYISQWNYHTGPRGELVCNENCTTHGIVGYSIAFNAYHIGTAFSGGLSVKDRIFCNCSVLNYLAHFDLSSMEFERLIGILAQFCINRDVNHPGITATHALAYKIHCKLRNEKDYSGSHIGVEVTEPYGGYGLFTTLLDFVKFATETYCMPVTDPDITSMVFHALANTTEEHMSADYLTRAGATPSVDQAKAFESLMGSVEALKLISQTTSLISAQSQVTDEADSNKEDGKGNDAGKESAKTDKGAADGKKTDTQKNSDETDDTVDEDEEDAEQEDQEQNDTPEEEEADGGAEDREGDEGEDQDASSDDTGSGDSSMPQDNKPTEPNLSDEKGIEIKVSLPDTETVSSVLVREELDKLLSNILVNPPKDMSPQGIATLTALKRYWVHTLSIETILGILEAHVELPASIKKSSKLHGVKNNE